MCENCGCDQSPTERFEEIMEEIHGLVAEAAEIVREEAGPNSGALLRTESYWKPQIEGIVGYWSERGGSMCTMADTLKELRHPDLD